MVDKCKHASYVHEVDFFKAFEEANGETIIVTDFDSVLEELMDYLEKTKFKQCESCGGLHSELKFKIFDKQYYFTLWKIEEKGKTIVEADHRKLREHSRE